MFALVTMLPADRHAVTASSEYRFLRPVPQNTRAVLSADVVRLGRTLAHVDARLCVDDRVCAEARYVKSVISVG
jgi:acyl-coenzyme A thioesterase PaaI-like protein